MERKVVAAARKYAEEIFATNYNSVLVFHDLVHTRTVVAAVSEIGEGEGVSPDEIAILQVAAWFHDLGYLQNPVGHEQISASMARKFLSDFEVPASEIKLVEDLILSTEINQVPKNMLEEIIRDADMAHLGMENAKERSDFLRIEQEALKKKSFSNREWLKTNIDFYNGRSYYTATARSLFESGKDRHLANMREKLNKLSAG